MVLVLGIRPSGYIGWLGDRNGFCSHIRPLLCHGGIPIGNLLQACLDSPPPEAGLYSNGKFTPVLNGTALDQVSLQLTAKHHWILAVLTILAGVLSAFVVQRYIGVTRVLRSLRERTAAALALVPKKDLDAGLQLRSIAEAAARGEPPIWTRASSVASVPTIRA